MSVPVAYITTLAVWATTPLAIQWSSATLSPSASVLMRMGVSWMLAGVCILLWKPSLFGFRQHWRAYLAGSLGVFPAMPLVYAASTQLSSGTIAVLFGLAPFITAALSQVLLRTNEMSSSRYAALTIAFCGVLLLVQGGEAQGQTLAVYPVALMLLSVCFYSGSGVLLKKCQPNHHVVSQLFGSLSFALPSLLLMWWLQDGDMPAKPAQRELLALVYLAIVGGLVGWTAYFYLMRFISATSVALVTFITPIIALLLGMALNGESLSPTAALGVSVILVGLMLFNRLHLPVIKYWRARWQ